MLKYNGRGPPHCNWHRLAPSGTEPSATQLGGRALHAVGAEHLSIKKMCWPNGLRSEREAVDKGRFTNIRN